MKSERASIGIFQTMRIKIWWGSVRSDLKKIVSFTLKMSKNYLIRNFPRNGRLSVKIYKDKKDVAINWRLNPPELSVRFLSRPGCPSALSPGTGPNSGMCWTGTEIPSLSRDNQGSAKGRVFGFRVGFRVEDLKIRVSGRVPGCAPGPGTRRKPGYKLCFHTSKFKNFMISGNIFWDSQLNCARLQWQSD